MPTGATVDLALTSLIYDNVIADGSSISAVAPFKAGIVPTDAGKVRGEVSPILQVNFTDGYSTYVRGSVRFGGELVGGGASIGLSKQW
jgi:hypothetical protein